MVQFIEHPGLQTRYVLPACDAKGPDWPKKSASLAIRCVFGCAASPAGDVDHSFYANDGRTYGVCVETMTLTPNSKASVIVPMYRFARGLLPCRKLVLAVFATRDVRGLACEVAGWMFDTEARRWEAPLDKQMFKRKGKRFAIVPRERLIDVSCLVRMADQWRCAI